MFTSFEKYRITWERFNYCGMLTPQISSHCVDKTAEFIAYHGDREAHLDSFISVWGGKVKPDFVVNLMFGLKCIL